MSRAPATTRGLATGALEAGAATDTGSLRDRNEDRYFLDPERGIFLVADGVGGQAAGELAAQTAVDAIRESLSDNSAPAPDRVRAAITQANNRIFDVAQHDADLNGMACVLTLALVENGRITIGHVGDSRLYLIWNGLIRKLTSDHSPVGESEDSGELNEAEAMLHPRRNEVFRDVGSRLRAPDDPEFIEVRECRLRPDAAILLCSDGLTDQIPSDQVLEIAECFDGDAARTATSLVEAANQAGGKDNVTVLFAAGREFRNRAGATRPRLSPRNSTTRAFPAARRPGRLLTGRMAFLTYGLLLGMLLWAALRTRG